MIIRIIAFLAAFLLLFSAKTPLPEESDILLEVPAYNENTQADEIIGAKGSRFYIERPVAEALNEVNASEFGLSCDSEDNTAAFQAALVFCMANPFTKLVIDSGTYYFKGNETLIIYNCNGLLIEGNDATFVFSDTGCKMGIYNSDCVEIRNLNIDWDWDKKPLASVVTVKNSNSDNNTMELVYKNPEYCNESNAFVAITQCDSETFTFGSKGSAREMYFSTESEMIKSIEKISEDTIKITHNGALKNFKDGETYILRHFVYDGTMFHLSENSKNVTFNNVSIYGSMGMAYICEGSSSHFQIINSFVGVEPTQKDKRCVSATADAIHIANTKGCFNISNCDISAMGDDAINVHDGLGYISAVSGNTITMYASAMRLKVGDTLAFKDGGFNDVDTTARITSVDNSNGAIKTVELDCNIEELIKVGYIAYNTACNSSNYVISNNYFHENRARGLLLQSSNGLCENNKFYKTMAQAIKVVMDIVPDRWQEGTGADNIVIRNNEFINCNYSNWGSLIEINTNIDGKAANCFAFTNIEISGNIINDLPSRFITADNVNGIKIVGNTVNIGSEFNQNSAKGKIYLKENCANVEYSENVYQGDCNDLVAVVKTDTSSLWAQVNSQLKNNN